MSWKSLLSDACREAARVIDSIGDRGKEYVGQGPSGDRTLLADAVSESTILNVISSASEISFLTEEQGFVGKKDNAYIAIIDPLDGSSNYLRGIPFYCISIAIFDNRIKRVVAASVFDPLRDVMYYAEIGKRAIRNDKEIAHSQAVRVKGSILGVDINHTNEAVLSKLSKLILSAGRTVHLGANALEICYVADGKIDCFVDVRGLIRQTDVMAACYILEMAGGSVSDEKGRSLSVQLDKLTGKNIIAAPTKDIQREVISILKGR